jgi:hypothetical protein
MRLPVKRKRSQARYQTQREKREQMENLILENCQLEWNRRAGILYVHNKDTGASVLRVQGLPATRNRVALRPGSIIDIRTDEEHSLIPVWEPESAAGNPV